MKQLYVEHEVEKQFMIVIFRKHCKFGYTQKVSISLSNYSLKLT